MPLEYRILSERNVVYVRCWDYVDLDQSQASLSDYQKNPEYRIGLSQVLDLTGVTGFERNFAGIMKMQASQVEALTSSGETTYFIFVAPDALTRSMANAALKSWREIAPVVPLVLSSLQEAADVLGIAVSDLTVSPQKVS